jgi:hypothetical protein
MVLAGCWEFLEPEFAEQDATTIMQVDARLNERGDFLLNALLIPGLDDEGFLREVVRDTLYVFGLPVASSAVNPNGSRLYSLTTRLSPQEMAQPFTIDPPVVAGLAPGPRVRWSSPLPLDPDTVRIAPGADLELRTAYDSTVNSIKPVHQWFFELSAGSARFHSRSAPTPRRPTGWSCLLPLFPSRRTASCVVCSHRFRQRRYSRTTTVAYTATHSSSTTPS